MFDFAVRGGAGGYGGYALIPPYQRKFQETTGFYRRLAGDYRGLHKTTDRLTEDYSELQYTGLL